MEQILLGLGLNIGVKEQSGLYIYHVPTPNYARLFNFPTW